MPLIEQCLCGGDDFVDGSERGIPIRVCTRCGALHQRVEMTEAEYLAYYVNEYPEERDVNYGHDFEHRTRVANLRLNEYDLPLDSVLLDVGSGAGLFVTEAHKRGYDAWGCELDDRADKSGRCYRGELPDIAFPTGHFDVVVMNDVLEHLVDPGRYLREIARILKPDGQLIVDIPHFWVEEGRHHWKETEHLWLFRESEIKELFDGCGFDVKDTLSPIPSKLAFYCVNREVRSTKILVPPGVGDIYWSLVKTKSFCDHVGIKGLPEIYISSLDVKSERSFDYVRRVPFVRAGGYCRHKKNDWGEVWREAYSCNEKWLFRSIENCDYFIAYNGILLNGRTIEEVDNLESDWLFPVWESLGERVYGEKFLIGGPYICAYFIGQGSYKKWIQNMPVEGIARGLKAMGARLGCRIVLIGAHWDAGTDLHSKMLKVLGGGCVDMVGKTTLGQCFSLLRRASGVVGFPSGVTMAAATFRTPTVMFWDKFFANEGFWSNCLPPQVVGNGYLPLNTTTRDPLGTAATFLEQMIRDGIDQDLVTPEMERRRILAESAPPPPNPLHMSVKSRRNKPVLKRVRSVRDLIDDPAPGVSPRRRSKLNVRPSPRVRPPRRNP